MKCRILNRNISILAVVLFSLSSCYQKQEADEVEIHRLEWDKVFALDDASESSPTCRVTIEMDMLEDTSHAAVLMNEMVMQHALGNRQPLWEAAADTFCRRMVSRYQKELLDLYRIDQEQGVNSSWYDYNYTVRTEYEPGLDGCLCAKITLRRYEGGVREVEEIQYLNFDKTTGQQVFLEDLWTSGSQVILPDLLLQALYHRFDCETLEGLRSKGILRLTDIYIPQNYKLGREGLLFLYNADEIAPYEAGQIALTIPYSQLESFRKTDK